jgi:membrane dipeptidase
MKLFDLHCDTILSAYSSNKNLLSNDLHISLDKAVKYEQYTQVLAIYSVHKLTDDEKYEQFLKVSDYYNEQKKSFPANFTSILAVEGANLLNGDLSRLDKLNERGVKFLTLVWGGSSCIGGAHNDGGGLTDFGKQTVARCFELGIVPDVSHSSDSLFWDAAEIADKYGKPIVATHSNSRHICSHLRTLPDDIFTKITDLGGLVGLSFVRPHLSDDESKCGIDTIISHIEHFLSLGDKAADVVCMGSDLDGTAPLPDGISDIGDVYKIYDRLLQLNYPQRLADKIFYENAQDFITRNNINP